MGPVVFEAVACATQLILTLSKNLGIVYKICSKLFLLLIINILSKVFRFGNWLFICGKGPKGL